MTDDALHHIVVVGGGAAGLELATKLGDRLGRRKRARVTLVDRSRTHIWKPLLHSVAAGSLRRSQHELNYIAQAHWHHFRYRNGEMIGLDRAAKTIDLAATQDSEGREISPEATIAYDTLVIAVGSVTNDFGTPGASEFAVPLETAEQASRFNHRLVNACLRAQDQDSPVRPGQLHVAIIGAGATGAELAAELHHSARAIIAYGLDRIDPERDLRIVLIEAGRPHPARPAAAHFRIDPTIFWRSSGWRCAPARGWPRCSRTASGSPTGRSFLPSWSLVGGREGARFPRQYRRARDQPHQPARRPPDARDLS